MYSFRRHLVRAACAWLIAQVCLLALSSAVMALTVPTVAALECTCAHGESHSCPMHHPAEKSKSDCSCRSTTDGPGAVIAALLGPIAVIPASLAADSAPSRGERLQITSTVPFDALSVPDGPPPRA
jgi:hypothetical protein